MIDPMLPQPATDAADFLPGPLGLRLDETFVPFTALHGAPDRLDQILPIGQFRQTPDRLALRFAPHVIWISGTVPEGDWRQVDISHGVTHMRLRGVEALHFLAFYTAADLHSSAIRKSGAVRTRLNHYDCALWWTNTRDIHLLTDRSIAQSLCDHLRTIARRHPGLDPEQSPRPVAPDAPDRRG